MFIFKEIITCIKYCHKEIIRDLEIAKGVDGNVRELTATR